MYVRHLRNKIDSASDRKLIRTVRGMGCLREATNYNVVRGNALESNYRLYHVVDGKRVQFSGRTAY